MVKFRGELAELQAHMTALGYQGEWTEDNGKHAFRSEDGAVLNWWPSTGTLQVQGPTSVRNKLEEAISIVLSGNSSPVGVPKTSSADTQLDATSSPVAISPPVVEESEKIFVVYGHDDQAREQLELILHRLGLDPFVLGNTGGGGMTIIEALEKEINSPNTGNRFGIVLLTPDDRGYKWGDDSNGPEPRARQNVVMEMGMLFAAFGRPRVAILKKGHVVLPSDIGTIIHLPFNDHVRETVPKLCDRLREAGFQLSADAITRASA